MSVDISFSLTLHVLLIFVALSILFIFVVSKVERQVFSDQIRDKLTPQITKALNKADTDGKYKVYVRNNMSEITQLRSAYSSDTKATSINNRYIRILMIVVASLIGACVVVPLFYLFFAAKYKFPFGLILLENVILFILIGVFEVLFFLKFARKYVPVLPSKFVDRVYQRLNG